MGPFPASKCLMVNLNSPLLELLCCTDTKPGALGGGHWPLQASCCLLASGLLYLFVCLFFFNEGCLTINGEAGTPWPLALCPSVVCHSPWLGPVPTSSYPEGISSPWRMQGAVGHGSIGPLCNPSWDTGSLCSTARPQGCFIASSGPHFICGPWGWCSGWCLESGCLVFGP